MPAPVASFPTSKYVSSTIVDETYRSAWSVR
jgi:hypothetical protein